MKLEDLGYYNKLEKYSKEQKLDSFEIGRIIAEHKERLIACLALQELENQPY